MFRIVKAENCDVLEDYRGKSVASMNQRILYDLHRVTNPNYI